MRASRELEELALEIGTAPAPLCDGATALIMACVRTL